jgi:hypothetical protein
MVLLTPFQVQHKLEKSFGQNRNSMGNTRWLQKIGCTKTNSRNSIEAISSSDDCSAVLLCCTSYTSKSEEDCCTADQSMIFQFSSKQETNDFPGSWTRSTQAPIRRRAKLWKTDGDLAMNEWMIRTAATLLLPTRSLAVCPCLGLQSSGSESFLLVLKSSEENFVCFLLHRPVDSAIFFYKKCTLLFLQCLSPIGMKWNGGDGGVNCPW